MKKNVKKEFHNLTDLDVVEVSFVSKGANQKKFAIFKSADADNSLNTNETIIKAILDGKFGDQEIDQAIVKTLRDSKVSEEDIQAITTSIKMMKSVEGRLPKEIASRLRTLVGNSSESKGAGGDNPKDQVTKNRQNLRGEDMKIDLEELTPEVRAHIEKLEKDRNDERSKRLIKEFVSKASEFKNLGTKPEEFGLVLKEFKEGASEQFETVIKVLQTADEKISTLSKEKEEVSKELEEIKKTADAKKEGDDTDGKKDEEAKVEEVSEIKKSMTALNERLEKLQSSPTAPKSEDSDNTEEINKEDKGGEDIWAGVL